MKRRFLQFSLRGLLGVAAVVCLLLGGRHLLETYGDYVEVGDISHGDQIAIKGRIVRVFGPPNLSVKVHSYNVDAMAGVTTTTQSVERSWLCCYDFKDVALLDGPGNWIVEVELAGGRYWDIAASKKFKVPANQLGRSP